MWRLSSNVNTRMRANLSKYEVLISSLQNSTDLMGYLRANFICYLIFFSVTLAYVTFCMGCSAKNCDTCSLPNNCYLCKVKLNICIIHKRNKSEKWNVWKLLIEGEEGIVWKRTIYKGYQKKTRHYYLCNNYNLREVVDMVHIWAFEL